MKKITAFLLALVLLTVPILSHAYSDVNPNTWYAKAIDTVTEQGLFSGIGNNKFNPNGSMTRAMFVTVLASMSDAELTDTNSSHFLDVNQNAWYAKQIEWAVQNKLTAGTGKFTFSPDKNITREQAVTFLYNYTIMANGDTSTRPITKNFKDYHKVSTWAQESMNWAITHGIMAGDNNRNLNPGKTATRAETAQLFMRYTEKFPERIQENNTPDLPKPDEIDKIIYNMSTEELAGQMLVARYSTNMKPLPLGGYTLYAKDFENKTEQEVKNMIARLKQNAKIPLFIAVDEEGGKVNRVSLNTNLRPEPFKSMREIFESYGLNGIKRDTEEKCKLLQNLGINLNLAPVCDISLNPNDYIYERTSGQDAETTADIIKTIVTTMNEHEMYGALKHFPGYGNNKDTHSGISIDTKPLESFEQNDLIPFISGIESNAPCVLVSHNVIQCIDPNKPASLSKPVHDYLRNELKFEGLILTDDLEMQGIKPYTSSPAVDAILAGNDIILTSDPETDHANIIKAVNQNIITKDRLRESVRRILETKL